MWNENVSSVIAQGNPHRLISEDTSAYHHQRHRRLSMSKRRMKSWNPKPRHLPQAGYHAVAGDNVGPLLPTAP